MKSFFRFSAQADAQSATLAIFDVIGLWGLQAEDFRAALAAVTAPRINLEINSPGGEVFAGIAIYNLLKASGKTIDAKVMGLAASAAAIILMSGDTITVPENCFVMIHRCSGPAEGHADALRESAATLDKIDASQTRIYSSRTGLSEHKVRELLAAETWLSGAEAVSMGFATAVTEGVQARTAFATAHAAIPAHVVASLGAPKSSSTSAQRAPTTADIWANRNFHKGSLK